MIEPTPQLRADFLEWLKTGSFRGVRIGMTRAECVERLGVPDGWQDYPKTLSKALGALESRGIPKLEGIKLLGLPEDWETYQPTLDDVANSEYSSLTWDGIEFLFSEENSVCELLIDCDSISERDFSKKFEDWQCMANSNHIGFIFGTGYSTWSDFDAHILTFAQCINFVFIRPANSNAGFTLDRIEQKDSSQRRTFYFDDED